MRDDFPPEFSGDPQIDSTLRAVPVKEGKQDTRYLLQADWPGPPRWIAHTLEGEDQPNAERLAECWNAMKGIEDPNAVQEFIRYMTRIPCRISEERLKEMGRKVVGCGECPSCMARALLRRR